MITISMFRDFKDISKYLIPSIKNEAYVVIVKSPWKPSLTGNTALCELSVHVNHLMYCSMIFANDAQVLIFWLILSTSPHCLQQQ